MKKQLYIVHNLTEENFQFADYIGGLPCPSLAIVANSNPLEGFGDITLVKNPENFSMTDFHGYLSDSYSIRYPEIFWNVDHDKLSEIKERCKEAMSHYGIPDQIQKEHLFYKDTDYDIYHITQGLYHKSSELQNNLSLRLLHLYEKGVKVNIEVSQEQFPISFLKEDTISELRALIREIPETDFRKKVTTLPLVVRDQEDYIRDMYKGDLTPEEELDIFPQEKELMTKRGIFKNGEIGFTTYNKIQLYFSKKSHDYVSISSIRNETDKIESRVHDDWLDTTLFDCYQDCYFYKDKDKKVRADIDSLTKYMKNKSQLESTSIIPSVGEIRSSVTPKLKNLSQAEKMSHLIVDKEIFKETAQKLRDELWDLTDKLKSTYKFSIQPFTYTSDAIAIICEYGLSKQRSTLETGYNITDEQVKLIDDFLDSLKNAPTEYFELKAKKAIDLKYFDYAIVSKDVSEEILLSLQSKHIKIIRYNDEHSKIKALSSTLMGFGDLGSFRYKENNSDNNLTK